MKITVTIEDAILLKAQQLTGLSERSQLIQKALESLVARESALRLARLGGTEKDLKPIPRRRAL